VNQVEELERVRGNAEHFEIYCTVSGELFRFFLFAKHEERIDIRELAASRPFLQFIRVDGGRHNPFGWTEVKKIYRQFLDRDSRGDGLVSQADLLGLSLSNAIVARFFECVDRLNGRIDFKTCLPLLVALENLEEPQAVDFFFRLLDVDEDGRVGPDDIAFFYKAIASELDSDAPKMEEYLALLTDMCQGPHDGFTAEMLIASGHQVDVLKILIFPDSVM
jgi:Ca2+-binding EF-hand superfamily protein